MIALMVTMKIKPGHHDAFMAALLGDARGSAYDEPGCLRFDVVQDAQAPDTVYLYEVYRDEAALEAHRQASHYRTWRETAKDWFDGAPVVHRCVTVFPPEATWEAVKPRVG
ncbi:MAG: antibiotic biosynthesis monooxygenase [Candidatus Tectomicrobia bacterium]|uniref:Antibiotic biosynthesis monooxygenase n=1 Tax=Tectimicrobiota bacterium TaxID=2528274 RepID=A0A937VZW6_UNCTE|nr:antibiotic biosynthesis monooxygenase [Candidatus Tectomicrobia bacterium]